MSFLDTLMSYQFLSQALLTAAIVGVVSGAVGCIIVLRNLSLMGDAMSHAVLPGVAISYLLGIPAFIGALISGLLTSTLISTLIEYSKTKRDAAIGITFTTFFSVGVIIISMIQSTTSLYHMLFGSILTVTRHDFLMTAAVSLIVLIFIVIFYTPLKLTTFDPVFAEMNGLNPKFWQYVIMLMLALITVVSLQTVGIILVVAMLITPASAAYLITRSLHTMMFTAAAIGLISAVSGIYFSFIFNVPSGAAIVICSCIIYAAIFTIQTFRRKII
ncbi:metal ABC transporter permease [Macrococcus carouselicus]|uniref:Manganese transport system membrane protein MntC n=1 Tax=Macrococcus carouselicus TaxID=69969 RepID=A0A9Q8CNL2_9STAP|nr:metal ABC transporter permease [Macrococcus carouselicus]TDM04104.1 metal ABC transporter permease [Macrococcus carouselicus]